MNGPGKSRTTVKIFGIRKTKKARKIMLKEKQKIEIHHTKAMSTIDAFELERQSTTFES